jgi:NTP pyrophosphatase (non-canonical NTP hydrolase)
VTVAELNEFAAWANAQLAERYPQPESERILSHAVKISEELGELCSAVLAQAKLQRAEKLAEQSDENLGEEFADVLITTLLLAQDLGVDVESALENKISKIRSRFGPKQQ